MTSWPVEINMDWIREGQDPFGELFRLYDLAGIARKCKAETGWKAQALFFRRSGVFLPTCKRLRYLMRGQPSNIWIFCMDAGARIM